MIAYATSGHQKFTGIKFVKTSRNIIFAFVKKILLLWEEHLSSEKAEK